MLRAIGWGALAVMLGCGRIDFDPLPEPVVECSAQRVVHIVAGDGGLGWFTQVWPIPDVIVNYQSGYWYDDPALALAVGVEADHPLYARRGVLPTTTVLVAGRNETHTRLPSTTTISNGVEVVAAAATAQRTLAAVAPVIVLGSVGPYGPAANAPPPLTAVDSASAITMLDGLGVPNTQALVPDPGVSSTWFSGTATPEVARLAADLLFAANLFQHGVAATVLIPGLDDDPHPATVGELTTPADQIASILDSFYSELARYPEPTCSHGGQPLSLADNVVLLVNGDTYKNPYSGWGDATPNNTNVLFVRSNGFVRPGWFGSITNGNGLGFDPVSGLVSTTVSFTTTDTDAAVAGVLYAIVRGDVAAVAAVTATPFQGLIP